MLIQELLNNDPYIVPLEYPIVILNIKSDVCMFKNGKNTKQTSKIATRLNFVRNGEK